jgi:hypothetical protein
LRTAWLNVKWKKTLNWGMVNGVSTLYIINIPTTPTTATATTVRVQLKCDGTRWRTGREVKGKLVEWVSSILHTTSDHGVSSITTADAHTSAASCRLNWRPYRFKWTCPFHRKTKFGFCTCAITFQTQSNITTTTTTTIIITSMLDTFQLAAQRTRQNNPTHHTHYTLLCGRNACLKREKHDRRHSLLL